NYYHVDVVADAFTEGFCAGEKSGKQSGKDEIISKLVKNRIEELTQKANQVYILTSRVVNYIQKNGFKINSFHLNIFHENPKAILAVDNKLLLDDFFVESTYSKIFEMKRIFDEIFNVDLDMGLIGSDNLDLELLYEDGYEYSEQFA
ncbi:MAG: hypothetical protein ACR2MS_04475, partial [Weeksellaceae bacterium]